MSAPARTPWAVVVIHFRAQTAVDRLLARIETWSVRPTSVVVVDNSGEYRSADGSTTSVVRPGANLGYAGAANAGIAAARGALPDLAHVLLLTQDAVLEHDAAERLLRAAVERGAGVTGPLLVFASAPDRLFSRGGRLSARGIGTHPGQGEPRPVDLHGVVEVDWLDGAVLLLALEAIDAIGGLDDRYFLYYEEIDLQVRVRRAGYPVVLDRDAIGHQEPGNYRTYFKYRNGVYFTGKFRPQFGPWPVAAQFARDALRALARRRPFQPVWAIRGAIDGRRGRMGPPPPAVLGSPRRSRAER